MQANSRHYADRNVQYAGGFKGFKGFSGNSGGRKPYIWYKGYKYTWNETFSDYCCIFKPKGGGEPVVKKYKEEKLKDDLAAVKSAQEEAKAAAEAKKEEKEKPTTGPANGSDSVAKTPVGEPVVSRRLFVLRKAADKLYNLELPDDVDAAKKVALDALKIAEVAVKQQRVSEYDLLGAIASARDQINAAQDSQKTGIGKSNIESVLGQLAGKFQACANIIERNAAQNKAEEPKEEPKEASVEKKPSPEPEPKEEPKVEENPEDEPIEEGPKDDGKEGKYSSEEFLNRYKTDLYRYMPDAKDDFYAYMAAWEKNSNALDALLSNVKDRLYPHPDTHEGDPNFGRWVDKAKLYPHTNWAEMGPDSWEWVPFEEPKDIPEEDKVFSIDQIIEYTKERSLELTPRRGAVSEQDKKAISEKVNELIEVAKRKTTTEHEILTICAALYRATGLDWEGFLEWSSHYKSKPATLERFNEILQVSLPESSLAKIVSTAGPEPPTAEPTQPEEKPLPPMTQTGRGNAKPEQPQPEPTPEPEPPKPEPKDARSSAYDHMYASEILKSISETASEAEQQRAYAAWSNKFFATKSEKLVDVKWSDKFNKFFSDATIPAFVKRTVLNSVKELQLFKDNGYSFETLDSIDQISDPKTRRRLYLRNWMFSRAGGHYMAYYQKSYENIPAPEVPYRTRGRRYYKIWSLGGEGLESIGCLMKEGSAFRNAYDSSREDLVNFMRGHKFRARTSKEAKAKAKEKIDRYLDVAALSTTTDYEAKGIAYGIRYAIMRATYEAKTLKNVAPEDVIPAIIEKYIPEAAIRDIASRSPGYQYPQTSGVGGATHPEPKEEPKPEPKPRKPRKPRTKKTPPTPESEPKSEPEPKTEPKQEPKPEPKSDPKQEPKPEPKSDPKQEPKSEPKTEPKSEPKAEPKPEPKSEPKQEPKSEPKEEPTVAPSQGQTSSSGKRFSQPEFAVSYSADAIDKFCQNALETKRFNPDEYNSTVGLAVSTIVEYADNLLENPTSDVSEEQIKQAYRLHELRGGRSKTEMRSFLSQILKSRGANVIVKMLQAFSNSAKAIVPDTSRTYLYEDPSVQMGGKKSHISAIGLATASRKAIKLWKDVETNQTVTPERAAKILSDVTNKMVDYAQGVQERYQNHEQIPTQTANAVIKNEEKEPRGIAGWLDYLTNKGAPEDAPSNMGPRQLKETIDKILRNVQKLTAIDMGGIRTETEALEPKEIDLSATKTKPQKKRGRGRPKKAGIPPTPPERLAGVRAPIGTAGRPKKGSENSLADEDFHERQLESAEFKDVLGPDEYASLSEEEQDAYYNNWTKNRGGKALPAFERINKEWVDEVNSQKTDEELARRYDEYENDAKEVAAEKANEDAKEKKSAPKKSAAKKSRNSRGSNDEDAVQYARIRAPKPSVFFDGRKYLWNNKIGDYVWSFWADGHRVVKKLIDAKLEKAKRLIAAKAELEKQPDDPATSFDVVKAYQGKRIWMGEDAQTIQDGSVVAVKLRRPATDEQFATLKNLGFSYNEESNGFVKAGEMTDADCDTMKTCRLMFSDEDKSGRNPNHLDQESYATLRARGVIGHIPEELRGGVPARENSQKHAKNEGTVGSGWETFERDGRTYFRSGRAPNPETVEQLKSADFFYDDISRVWSKEGTLEENDGVLKKLGLRWDEYADEDLTKKYLGMDLPQTDWKALVSNPDALATELQNKYVVCNPEHVVEKRSGVDETYLDDSPKWDEDVSCALYDVLCPYENSAYNVKDPELVEIPIGDGTMLRFAVFDPQALSANEEGNDDGEVYAFRDPDNLTEGMALNLIEELNAIRKGESYGTEDANGTEGYDDPNKGWRSYGNAGGGGWGSYAADHGIGGDYGDSFTNLPEFEINPFKVNAPNILDVFNKSVFFIDRSTLEKLRSAKPIVRDDSANV